VTQKTIINIHQAKTHLSKLLEMVSNGKTIIIANAGKPVAVLGPIKPAGTDRKFGLLKNKIKISADFDALWITTFWMISRENNAFVTRYPYFSMVYARFRAAFQNC